MKISTEGIQGFADMSPDDKVNALLALDIPDPDYSGYVKKDVFDAKASEAAKLSKQLKERMTTEESAKADADKAMQDLQEKYNELLKSSTIANHTARYLALPGYDEKLARETAEALFNGDMDKVFENQQKANAAREKELLAEQTRNSPQPKGAGDGETEDPAVAFARRRAKERAENSKNTTEGLKKFML